jgi:WD40 repeat protein
VVGSLTSRGNEITSLAFTSDGGILFAGDAVGRLLVWARRWRRYRPEATAAAHSGPINAMVVSSDDRRLATAGTDNAVRVWGKFDAIENMFTVAGGLRGVVRRLQFTTDGRTLLAATDAAQVAGWRAHDGDMVCDWRLNQIMSTCQALADHGGLVALGRTDGMVNLYQIGKVPPPSSAGTASQGNDKLEKTSKRRR